MPLPVLVPMKTSFPSAKALKLFTWLTVSASKLISTKCKQRCHFPFWFQWKHLSRLPKLWNFQLVVSKCFQIKLISNKFFFTGRCHFQLSNIRITKRFWLAGGDDYLRGATYINHQVALRANFKIYSRSAKGGEKGDPNRNPWLAKMVDF